MIINPIISKNWRLLFNIFEPPQSEKILSYIAAAGNYEEKRKFLKIVGSNFKLVDGSLYVSYTYRFRIFTKMSKNDLGSGLQKVRIAF